MPIDRARRLTGPDALLLHMERPDVPMHTLKVLVLDTSARASAVTLDEVREVVRDRLGLVPWSTQRIATGLTFGGRPFWVDDEAFDLGAHLDEVTAPSQDREGLDAVCGRLAERHLDRSRPLWALTLVHGLEGGQQAVVVRLHHAVADGIAARNTFLAATGRRGAPPLEPIAALPARPTPAHELHRAALRELAGAPRAAVRTVATARAGRRGATQVTDRGELPGGVNQPRTSLNRPSGGARVCASASIDLAAVKEVARAAGVSLNGALHAVVAGAVRAEMLDRGETALRPAVATFGVAADTASTRVFGNQVAPTSAYLHVDEADPLARLMATARSCALSVEVRRRRGFELTDALSALTPRLVPVLRDVVATRYPRVLNHLSTANVAGPDHARWLGDVEVSDWISYAVAVAPADVNLTVYSYAGRLSLGLVATPESMPDPAAFLRRLEPALAELRAALHLTTLEDLCPSRT